MFFVFAWSSCVHSGSRNFRRIRWEINKFTQSCKQRLELIATFVSSESSRCSYRLQWVTCLIDVYFLNICLTCIKQVHFTSCKILFMKIQTYLKCKSNKIMLNTCIGILFITKVFIVLYGSCFQVRLLIPYYKLKHNYTGKSGLDIFLSVCLNFNLFNQAEALFKCPLKKQELHVLCFWSNKTNFFFHCRFWLENSRESKQGDIVSSKRYRVWKIENYFTCFYIWCSRVK